MAWERFFVAVDLNFFLMTQKGVNMFKSESSQDLSKDFQSVQKFVNQISEKAGGQPEMEELSAVVAELKDKVDELQECMRSKEDQESISEKLIEAEQAADSALKVAKVSDSQELLGEIQKAHDEIKSFKSKYVS